MLGMSVPQYFISQKYVVTNTFFHTSLVYTHTHSPLGQKPGRYIVFMILLIPSYIREPWDEAMCIYNVTMVLKFNFISN